MLAVLVISPHPQVPGGVSSFIECMKAHVTHSHIDSFYVGSTSGEGLFSVWCRLIFRPIELALLVKRKKYDVVHLNPSFDKKSLIRDSLLVLGLILVGYKKTLFYIHGWDPSVYQFIARHTVFKRGLVFLMNKIGMIAVLSDSFRLSLKEIGVYPNRIALTRTMFNSTEQNLFAQIPRLRARPFILFLSRFEPEKGGKELIEAFCSLAADYPNYDLVMAGEGKDGPLLRRLAKTSKFDERITFPGYVQGPTKWELLMHCTLFALPTYYRSEGMPVAVLEAMAAGKPLLVGTAGALTTFLEQPRNGVVLDKITSETVAFGLSYLLSQQRVRDTAGKKNSDLAWQEFSADRVTAEIEDLYQRVSAC